MSEFVVSEFDVLDYLGQKGYQGKPSGSQVTYPCFLDCNEPADSRKRKLYVNPETSLYQCFVCGSSGGSYLLQKHFGDDPEPIRAGADLHTRRKILDWAAQVGSAMLANNEEVLLYLLGQRGLSPETVLERQLGYVGPGWSLTGSLPEAFSRQELTNTGLVYRDGPRAYQDFFYNHLLIPYLSRSGVQQIRGRAWGQAKGGKYLTGPGEEVHLFDADSIEGADDVIITEGEFDAMALRQHLAGAPEDRARKVAVVGLAGAGQFKDGFERYFTDTKRIFIGLDADDTGRREAVKIKERFGARARILELPAELPKADWTEFLLPVPADADPAWKAAHPHAGHGWRDVMSMLANAAGKRVFSVSEAGHSYRQSRINRVGLATGYAEFDSTIFPGLLPGQLWVVLAKTGSGKTVLLCNLTFNMRAQRILFLSLEMTREEVYDRLRRLWHFHVDARASDDEVERGYANVAICDENRIGDRDFPAIVAEYAMEFGGPPDVVIVDYLGYYARGQAGSSPYEKTTNAAMQLKAEAKAGRFVVIAPSQVNRVAKEGKPITIDDARDSGAVEETADYLTSLWRPDDGLVLEENTTVMPSGQTKHTILKSRHGGKGRTFTYQFDPLTLALVDHLGPKSKQAANHSYLYHHRGVTYESLREQETAPFQQSLLGAHR